MAEITINNLEAGSKVDFQFSGKFIKDFQSPIFSFYVPNYPQLITKAANITVKLDNTKITTTTATETVYFDYAEVKEITRNSKTKKQYAKITISICNSNGTPIATDINVGDEITITTDKSLLIPKGQTSPYKTKVIGTGTGVYNLKGHTINIEIERTSQNKGNNVGIVVSNNNKIVIEKKKNYSMKKATIDVGNDKDFIETLYNVTGSTRVIDVVIYAFSQYKTGERNSIKYLMSDSKKDIINRTVLSDMSPPSFSTISGSRAQNSAYSYYTDGDPTQNFKCIASHIDAVKFGENLEFYVAVARYYKNGLDEWYGEWIQKDKDENAIWRKVVPGGVGQ